MRLLSYRTLRLHSISYKQFRGRNLVLMTKQVPSAPVLPLVRWACLVTRPSFDILAPRGRLETGDAFCTRPFHLTR